MANKDYIEEEANALIKELHKKANELEYGFVADNVRMIAYYEKVQRDFAIRTGKEYEGVDFDWLASRLACEMEGTNGASFQYDLYQIEEFISNICETAEAA